MSEPIENPEQLPVTWATEDLEDVMSPRFRLMHMDINSSTWKQFPIPLYTRPIRDLTDEEIQEIGKPILGYVTMDEMNFARAIIKESRGKK